MCVCVYVYAYTYESFYLYMFICFLGDALSVMVISVGNGIGDPSSNPGKSCFCFTPC